MGPRVPVKLRPDVYCCKIVDIIRVGRKVGKVTRLRKEDMIRYEKEKEHPPSSPEVEKELVETSSETANDCSVEEVLNDAVDNLDPLDIVVKSESDQHEMHPPSENEETVSSNSSSLALVLTDSEGDDDNDDYDDAQENDIICNLVEDVQHKKHLVPRRVVLSRSRPRREKIKFGSSKFELKNSTQNLDRFFVHKPCFKVRLKKQRKSTRSKGKDSVVTDSEDLFEFKSKVICDVATEHGSIDVVDVNFDTKQTETMSVQGKSVMLLSEEHPVVEYEFEKDTETFVDVEDVKDLNEVCTFGDLVIDEEKVLFVNLENETCTELDETEASISDGFIEDSLDDELFIEEGIVLVPEVVQVLNKEEDLNKLVAHEMDDVPAVLEMNCDKPDEDKIGDEADLEVGNKNDVDVDAAFESVVEYDMKKSHSSIPFYKNEPKPDDGHGMPESPKVEDLLLSTDDGEPAIVLPERVSEVCDADNVQDSSTVLPVTPMSTESGNDRHATDAEEDKTATVTKEEEVDKLQPCLAAWTLTSRQAREESSLTSCLEIYQVQSGSEASLEELRLNLPPTLPIPDTKTISALSTSPHPQDNISELLTLPPSSTVEQATSELLTPSCVHLQKLSLPSSSTAVPATSPPPDKISNMLNPTPSSTSEPVTSSPPQDNTSEPLTLPQSSTSPPPLDNISELITLPLSSSSPPPQDNISELLTPSCVQLQSYLSDAIVSDLDLEVLASLDTSPDVIITEVPHVARDMENNVVDGVKLENAKTSDDSDSDVVLLSDDETDLCSPTPSLTIISSWQLDILSKTWQAWPVPTQAILLHLGLETGLSDATIRDWFSKRTDQELVRVWGELEKM